MNKVKLGPIELARQKDQSKPSEKLTLTMFDDDLVEMVHYDEKGLQISKKQFPCVDSYHARKKIDLVIKRLENDKYIRLAETESSPTLS